jgi:hypothetical protein
LLALGVVLPSKIVGVNVGPAVSVGLIAWCGAPGRHGPTCKSKCPAHSEGRTTLAQASGVVRFEVVM